MLRKHILSNYSEVSFLGEKTHLNQITMLTETIEDSDPDEFYFLSGSTIETKSIESSDPDEFNLSETTLQTFVIEDSDPDEFI